MTAASNARLIRAAAPTIRPRVAIVLGSGLGDFVASVEAAIRVPFVDLEGFPRPTVSGHRGELVLGRIAGCDVLLSSGRGHFYEHGDAREMAGPIATFAALGVETLILTNAAGSLRADVPPGTPMVICDHIALGLPNPLVGTQGDARFVSMVDAYDPALRAVARAAATAAEVASAEGVYMWFSGPSFETPAEIRAARALGADAVGMSTAPEVILARHAGLRVLALSMITNFAAGMTGRPLSHDETRREAAAGAEALGRLLVEILRRIATEEAR